jgi:hypothetical protein
MIPLILGGHEQLAAERGIPQDPVVRQNRSSGELIPECVPRLGELGMNFNTANESDGSDDPRTIARYCTLETS